MITIVSNYKSKINEFFYKLDKNTYIILNDKEKEEIKKIITKLYEKYPNTLAEFEFFDVLSVVVFYYFDSKGKVIRYGTFNNLFSVSKKAINDCLNKIENLIENVLNELKIEEPKNKDKITKKEVKEILKKFHKTTIVDILWPTVEKIYELSKQDLLRRGYWSDTVLFVIWWYLTEQLHRHNVINFRFKTTDFNKIFGFSTTNNSLRGIKFIKENIVVKISKDQIEIKFKNETVGKYKKQYIVVAMELEDYVKKLEELIKKQDLSAFVKVLRDFINELEEIDNRNRTYVIGEKDFPSELVEKVIELIDSLNTNHSEESVEEINDLKSNLEDLYNMYVQNPKVVCKN